MYTKGLNKSFYNLRGSHLKINMIKYICHNKDMNYTLKNKNGHTVVDISLNVKYRFVKVFLYVSKEVQLSCNIAINLHFGMNSKSLHFNTNSEGRWQKCVFHRMSGCPNIVKYYWSKTNDNVTAVFLNAATLTIFSQRFA